MILFYISTVGFFLLFLADYIQVKRRKGGSAGFSTLGYIVIAGLLIYMLREGPGITVYPLSTLLGWVLVPLFAILLLYSVLIEIYVLRKRRNLASDIALMEGTYGICRHPGFLWFFLLLASLYLIHRSRLYLVLSGYMVLLNFILIIFEDRFMFPRIFRNYSEYSERVPFLVPAFGHNRD